MIVFIRGIEKIIQINLYSNRNRHTDEENKQESPKGKVQVSRSVMSDSLQPHESQQARQGKGKGANDK